MSNRERIGVVEASRILGLTIMWARHIIDTSGIPVERDHAGRRLIRKTDVEALAEERRSLRTQHLIRAQVGKR